MIHKAIKGFEDYLVTDTGKVYSLKRKKYMNQHANNRGYLMVQLCKNGKHKSFLVHRLVAQAFIENPENKAQIDHIDRNQDNNHVSNLRWVDNTENYMNRDHEKVRKAGLKGAQASKKKRSKALVWLVNDEVSFGYPSIKSVHDINGATLTEHMQRNKETKTFKSKGKVFIFE